jgi:hypothetical protein
MATHNFSVFIADSLVGRLGGLLPGDPRMRESLRAEAEIAP